MSPLVENFGALSLAYFVPELGRTSETFVNSLIEGLIDRGVDLRLLANSMSPDVHLRGSPRIENVCFLSLTRRIDKLAFRLASPEAKHGLLVRNCDRALTPKLAQGRVDAAYIEFGTTAVYCAPTLCKMKIPYAVHLHGNDITSALSNSLYRNSLALALSNAGSIIVGSEHMRRLVTLEVGAKVQIDVVPLGVHTGGLSPVTDSDKEPRPSIVFLGRFVPKKHPLALIEAFRLVKRSVPNAHLTMIGDGPERSAVVERIKQYRIEDSVELTGALVHEKAMDKVRKCWVYAQHSVTARDGDQEGFGISMAEASLLELPVVATWHNGIPEQVVHGKTGFLVAEHDYETMALRLIELLSDRNLRHSMGRQGRENITRRFSVVERAHQVEIVLRRIASK